ncbi:hypothetical protein FQR65_LT05457 [Abscondita terminalis]|nr:hypothetical protein FQR65_LT05457 [Abscondita terminalis]
MMSLIEFFCSKQFRSASIATVLIMGTFLYIGWSSPAIPLLTSSNSPIGVELTKKESSWVVSVLALGIMPGSVIITFLVDSIGRKKAMLVGAVLVIAPWILIIFAQSFIMLLVARLVGGFGYSLSVGVIPLYIGEISETHNRGTLCSFPPIGTVLGSVLVYTIGPFVSFTTLAIICASVPMIFVVGFYFIPESPYYLVKTNQPEAARNTLRYLTETDNVDEWFNEIETIIHNDGASKFKLSELLYGRNHRKSFMIVIGRCSPKLYTKLTIHIAALKTVAIFSGSVVINSYMQTILEESQTSLSVQTSSVIFAAIQIPCGANIRIFYTIHFTIFVSVIMSSYLMDKLGRRLLLIISSSGCAVSLAGEGMYFYLLQRKDVDLSNAYFVPTLCLTLNYIMMWFGIANLQFVAAGELFTPKAKKMGGTVFAFYSGFLIFITSKIFTPIIEVWGMHVAFWIFAGVCVLAILFGLFVLPETKGKTFEEIQEMLYGKRAPKEHNNT